MSDKIYLKANCKKSKFGIRISGKADVLIEQIRQNTNSKGYINLELTERRQTGQYGETHSLSVDTWEPADKPANASPTPAPTPQTPQAPASGWTVPGQKDDAGLPF